MNVNIDLAVEIGQAGLLVVVQPDQLKAECALRGWSLTHLARRAGISYPTLRSALRGNPVRPRTAWKLTRALTDCDGQSELRVLQKAA